MHCKQRSRCAGRKGPAGPQRPGAAAWRTPALLLALALAAGCAHRSAPPLRIEAVETVGWNIAERPCETPERIERRKQPNPHDPQVTDEVIETHCPGWVATVYQANGTRPPRLLPVGVRMTGRHPGLPEALQVGAAAEQVRARLGPPTARDPAALAYRLRPDGPADDVVRFILAKGRVTAIEWAWYVD